MSAVLAAPLPLRRVRRERAMLRWATGLAIAFGCLVVMLFPARFV